MNLQKFLAAALVPREEAIEVPELAEWFEGKPAVWVVRGLTAAEQARANEAAEDGGETLRAVVTALAGDGGKAESLRKLLGVATEDVPADVSRRIEMIAAGSVSPEIGPMNRDVVVKLAESFPGVFYKLANRIFTLTSMGHEPGKPKRSGEIHP